MDAGRSPAQAQNEARHEAKAATEPAADEPAERSRRAGLGRPFGARRVNRPHEPAPDQRKHRGAEGVVRPVTTVLI